MFTGVNASINELSAGAICVLLHLLVTPDSCSLAYTGGMRAARSIHLLIAVAILFSQIASGIHMAGHVHLPASVAPAGPTLAFSPASATASATASPPHDSALAALHAMHPEQLTAAEHEALHQQEHRAPSEPAHGKAYLDKSCAIYHIYAGSHCLGALSGVAVRPVYVASGQSTNEPPALLTQRTAYNAIRGPPALS